MEHSQQRRIILAVSGGIAAYKSPDIVRRLKEQGYDVRVVMTQGSKAFITPLTMQAVSGLPVHDDLLDPAAEAGMGHIELARWADLIVIAPATAGVMAGIAHGHAGDLLSTLCLASSAPVALVPAMNQQMWAAVPTQRNLEQLKQDGKLIWGPDSGSQACGDIGAGRMIEPLDIVSRVVAFFDKQPARGGALAGRAVMITAGPTHEALDPVRYLSNYSSGKMGFALASAALAQGAKVVLIAGPVNLPTPLGVRRIDVASAQEMYDAVHSHITEQDVFIGCAAVADYRAAEVQPAKIKKGPGSDEALTISLVRNPDILASVAALAKPPLTCGFAAETHDLESYAMMKLKNKKLDLIAANDVSDGKGFNHDTNALTVFSRESDKIQRTELGDGSKGALAERLIAMISQRLKSSPKTI